MYTLNEIARVLASVEDEKLIERFLKSLLTEKETFEVSSRWELVKLLREGKSQRNISDELGISLCKITRGSKELKKRSSAFKRMLEIYEEL